ncbi:hypothetical protein ACQP2U_43455 (plasmid) [Nocardia sp. CA-084685]|uniref:hypothetical protein n=1 Tax=Nocardia sp. CA-084685 TaxID=3239970 RepID=UPI003D99A23F
MGSSRIEPSSHPWWCVRDVAPQGEDPGRDAIYQHYGQPIHLPVAEHPNKPIELKRCCYARFDDRSRDYHIDVDVNKYGFTLTEQEASHLASRVRSLAAGTGDEEPFALHHTPSETLTTYQMTTEPLNGGPGERKVVIMGGGTVFVFTTAEADKFADELEFLSADLQRDRI